MERRIRNHGASRPQLKPGSLGGRRRCGLYRRALCKGPGGSSIGGHAGRWGSVAAGNRDRGRDKGRKWSRPSLLNAWKGARATGISVDWLLGFDVPRARSDREKIGALLPELRQQLAARLAAKLGTAAEFASAVLPSGE